ncbi:MAG: polyprenyl synthetase family protein [Bacteroidaceae bacterium]|nr:polyprenyl synthetase family protein [Bacteroidaceae bacterium]
MDILSNIRRPVEQEMAQYKALFDDALRHDNPLLDVALTHLGQRRGKMMRPLLVILCAKYCGAVNEAVLHAAVALELLHTASLVHDDVVDESDRRRGQRSVNALLDNKAAVLVGDYLLSKALQHAALTRSLEVVETVACLGQTLADGELLQLTNLDNTDFSEAHYLDIIRKKTASLFVACARCGALLAGAPAETLAQLTDFAERVGICFQIRDDIFDYAQHDVGKPVGHDILEGKITLPLLHCLQSEQAGAEREMALMTRRGEAGAGEVEHLLNFTVEQGGLDYAKRQMDAYCREAVQKLQRDGEVADSLRLYAAFVAGRDV